MAGAALAPPPWAGHFHTSFSLATPYSLGEVMLYGTWAFNEKKFPLSHYKSSVVWGTKLDKIESFPFREGTGTERTGTYSTGYLQNYLVGSGFVSQRYGTYPRFRISIRIRTKMSRIRNNGWRVVSWEPNTAELLHVLVTRLRTYIVTPGTVLAHSPGINSKT